MHYGASTCELRGRRIEGGERIKCVHTRLLAFNFAADYYGSFGFSAGRRWFFFLPSFLGWVDAFWRGFSPHKNTRVRELCLFLSSWFWLFWCGSYRYRVTSATLRSCYSSGFLWVFYHINFCAWPKMSFEFWFHEN